MVKVAFWDNRLCERGTTVALFDYAYYNVKLLGNESYIFYDINREDNKEDVINKFKKHFCVIGLNGFNEIHMYLEHMGIMFLYNIKYGTNDGKITEHAHTLIHAVFECEPHGSDRDVYVSLSSVLKNYNPSIPIFPHMVNLPDNFKNMRKELDIPADSMVFGRYGGKGEFDIPFVHNIVYQVALKNPKIYFLFANTNEFCPKLPNIIHIPAVIDLHKKVEFINTCDAMIHARYRGETFGLSIAEFSSKNKPVLCSSIHEGEDEHLRILGNKAIVYNENDLYFILTNLTRGFIELRDWNAYRDYTPENVMKIFNDVFIKRFLEPNVEPTI
jgi:hypothetical protein